MVVLKYLYKSWDDPPSKFPLKKNEPKTMGEINTYGWVYNSKNHGKVGAKKIDIRCYK